MVLTDEQLANLAELDQDEAVELVKTLNDEYKTLQGATTKGVQLKDESIKAFLDVSWDMAKLEKLQEEKPEVARILLKDFYDGKTIDEVKAMKANEQTAQENAVKAQLATERYDYLFTQLPEDLHEKFKAEYDVLTEGKNMTPELVDKFVSLVVTSIQPNMSAVIEQAKLASAWGSSAKVEKKSVSASDVEFSRNLIKNAG